MRDGGDDCDGGDDAFVHKIPLDGSDSSSLFPTLR